jgi:ATP-dependent Clp protease ATP-binding subunit ClpB
MTSLGEPGVGKTAIAEGLAHRIALSQIPENMKGRIYSLDLGALFAGAGKGEYEAVRNNSISLFWIYLSPSHPNFISA